MDNREPVFAARAVRLMVPPQAVKDKHVRLRVAVAVNGSIANSAAAAPDFAPRCLPDAAAIPKRDGLATGRGSVPAGQSPATTQSWRDNIAFKAMGWGL